MKQRLENMLASGRDSPLLRFSLGELLYKSGEAEAATAHLAKAVTQDPQYSAAWKLYGQALLAAGHAAQAADVLRQGIEVAQARGDNQAAKEMQVFAKRAAKHRNEDDA